MSQEHTSVDVEVIVTGRAPAPHAYVFREGGNRLTQVGGVLRASLLPGGRMVDSPCLAYVVRHPSAGVILIDTGFHPDAASHRRRDFGPAMSLVFRTLETAAEGYEAQLRALGVEPAEVERVVMTHLHVDHTSGMRLLPRARFTCDRREWQAANRRGGASRGFIAHHFPPLERMDLLDLQGEGVPYGPFGCSLDLLGDGSVRLLSTPGHTEGHLSVLLRGSGGPQVLVAGDAAYTLRSIDEQILPLLTVDDARYAATLRELKAFADGEPDALVIPTHDPTAWRALSS